MNMKKWFGRQEGQGLVEYSLILVLIAVVIIVIMALLGTRINQLFVRIMLEIDYPGIFGGSPVTLNTFNASASASCFSGSCSGVNASATVAASGSGDIYVQFTNSSGKSVIKSGNGNIQSGDLGGGSTGDTVKICVLGVEGHTLVDAPICTTATY